MIILISHLCIYTFIYVYVIHLCMLWVKKVYFRRPARQRKTRAAKGSIGRPGDPTLQPYTLQTVVPILPTPEGWKPGWSYSDPRI